MEVRRQPIDIWTESFDYSAVNSDVHPRPTMSDTMYRDIHDAFHDRYVRLLSIPTHVSEVWYDIHDATPLSSLIATKDETMDEKQTQVEISADFVVPPRVDDDMDNHIYMSVYGIGSVVLGTSNTSLTLHEIDALESAGKTLPSTPEIDMDLVEFVEYSIVLYDERDAVSMHVVNCIY